VKSASSAEGLKPAILSSPARWSYSTGERNENSKSHVDHINNASNNFSKENVGTRCVDDSTNPEVEINLANNIKGLCLVIKAKKTDFYVFICPEYFENSYTDLLEILQASFTYKNLVNERRILFSNEYFFYLIKNERFLSRKRISYN